MIDAQRDAAIHDRDFLPGNNRDSAGVLSVA
jgi:hypothetical protein